MSAVTVGLAMLGVLVPVPASAAENGSPVGRITSVVADPEIYDDDGVVVGGLRVSGWATDINLGDSAGAVEVSSGGTVQYAWVGSDWDQWEVRMPLPVGEHTVCATAVNVGEGEDTALGCLTATVPLFSPQPSTQTVTVHPLVGQDGSVFVLREERPVVRARACLDAASVEGEIARLGMVVEVGGWTDAGDHVVSSPPFYPNPVTADGQLCVETDWQVDEPLQPGVLYWATSRLVLDDREPGARADSGVEVAYSPLDAALASPAEGDVLEASKPILSVQVDRTWMSVAVDFRVTSVGSGTAVAEGRGTVDEQGVASWAVPFDDLSPGEHWWQVRVADQFGQSEWSRAWEFVRDVPRAPRPTSASMTDGSGVVQDGLEVAADPEPTVGASVCVEAGTWVAPVSDLSMRLGVVGDDGHRLESGTLALVADEHGDAICVDGSWRVSEDLHPGVHGAGAGGGCWSRTERMVRRRVVPGAGDR
ncbi:hypothetical protein ACTHAM_003026 [Cellulomonas soli]|uniref:hypothetical protein n=1 Tax=Cellulomonas soli TaxID=931535 RepID=UPI003F84CB77